MLTITKSLFVDGISPYQHAVVQDSLAMYKIYEKILFKNHIKNT